MKERRKPPRKQKSTKATVTIKKEEPKKPALGKSLVPVPDGEDDTSFDEHNKLLKAYAESSSKPSSKKRNEANVKDLMEMSFAMRRNDILLKGDSFQTLKKYPCLKSPQHVRIGICMHVKINYVRNYRC